MTPRWRGESNDSPYNRLCDEAGAYEDGLRDQFEALRIGQSFRDLGVEVDVIAVTDAFTEPLPEYPVRGFDVTYDGWHTLLESGLRSNLSHTRRKESSEIWDLVMETFRPRLNSFRLFQQLADAVLLRRFVVELDHRWPESFTHKEYFKPLVYAVLDLNGLISRSD